MGSPEAFGISLAYTVQLQVSCAPVVFASGRNPLIRKFCCKFNVSKEYECNFY